MAIASLTFGELPDSPQSPTSYHLPAEANQRLPGAWLFALHDAAVSGAASKQNHFDVYGPWSCDGFDDLRIAGGETSLILADLAIAVLVVWI